MVLMISPQIWPSPESPRVEAGKTTLPGHKTPLKNLPEIIPFQELVRGNKMFNHCLFLNKGEIVKIINTLLPPLLSIRSTSYCCQWSNHSELDCFCIQAF
jgi:hypothetical protein